MKIPKIIMKTTPWIVEDGYCAVRGLEGTDITKLENRIAFIEKTPRVRVGHYIERDTDHLNWKQGPKGEGGGDPAKDLTYGFDPDSRIWCDKELCSMGYILG